METAVLVVPPSSEISSETLSDASVKSKVAARLPVVETRACDVDRSTSTAVVPTGAERDRLFQQIVERYPFFADHQSKIERRISVHRVQVPDGHREMLRVMEIIRAGFTSLKPTHDILDLIF